jgi:DNA polymerase-3 subunit delta
MLKYTEFKNGLIGGDEYPVYLFEGEDAFFRERGLALIKKQFVTEPELNVALFNSEVGVQELLSSLDGYPFLSKKRLTVVREFYPKQDFFKNGLKGYLENPSEFGVLAILNEKPCEPLKKFDSVCVVDCKKADPTLLLKWIKSECSRENVYIDGEAAKTLAEYCLSDMTRIENETHKLMAYAGNGGSISVSDVDQMVAKDTEHKIYEMTDYIAKKKFDLALDVIRDMMSKGETAQRILSSVYNYFRRLLHAGISGKTASELAEGLGIKEYPAKKLIEQSAMFKKRALKSAVDRLTDADFKIKSGKADVNEQMWLTVFAIMIEK